MENKVNQLTTSTRSNAISMSTSVSIISPSRLYMLSKHQGKAAVIWNPTPRKIISGDEYQYGRTARKIEITAQSRVEAVFFNKNPFDQGRPMTWGSHFVIFNNLETGEYYHLEFKKFNTQNMDLGFEYIYDDELLRKVVPGAIFPRGTVFATSARISESGEWFPGIETRVATLSHAWTEEDSVYISESYAKLIGITFSRKIEHQHNEDEYVTLNLYGTIDYHQPFPLDGERVRPDGLVYGLRIKDKRNALVTLTKRALMEPDPYYDILFYADPSCVVTDIVVETDRYKNQSNNKKAYKRSTAPTSFLEEFERHNNTFNNDLVSWYKSKQRVGLKSSVINIDEDLWNLIFMARGGITKYQATGYENGNYNPIKRKLTHIGLKDWRVQITLRQDSEAKVRFKMTGMRGDKCTIGKIVPDRMMPLDDYGNRAQMGVGNFPAYRRQIFDLLIELDINFVNIHLHKRIKENVLKNNYIEAWKIAHEFFDTVSPEFGELCEEFTADERITLVKHFAKDENEFTVHQRSDSKRVGIAVVKALAEKYSDIKPTPVTFENEFGEVIRTKRAIPITSMYNIMLDKFGDDISSQSTSRLNIHGLPTSISKAERARNFFRAYVNRNVGETEGRLTINQRGGASLVRNLTLANSPELTDLAVTRLLRAENPFLLQYLVYPGEEKYNRSLQLISNILSDFGLIIRKEREEDRV